MDGSSYKDDHISPQGGRIQKKVLKLDGSSHDVHKMDGYKLKSAKWTDNVYIS